LKYQVIVSLETGLPLHFFGPFLGKFSDATMWKNSKVAQFLEEQDLWVIGDKGYQGIVIFLLLSSH
jgi:hypothetical protein